MKRIWIVGWLLLLTACTLPLTPAGAPTRPPQPPRPVGTPARPPGGMPPTKAATRPPRPTPTAPPTHTPTAIPPTPTLLPEMGGGGAALPALHAGQPVDIQRIHMADLTHGWAIGTQADVTGQHILRTADGGATWWEVGPPVGVEMADSQVYAFFPDAETAWVLYSIAPPMEPHTGVPLWITHDGGATWQPVSLDSGEAEFFGDAYFAADGDRAWLLVTVGAGMQHAYSNLYHSADGGQSWELLADPFADRAGDLMSLQHSGLDFHGDTGWVTKANGVMSGGALVVTEDGGRTWSMYPFQPPGFADPEAVLCDTYAPNLATHTFLLDCLDAANSLRVGFLAFFDGSQSQYYSLPTVYYDAAQVDARTMLLFGHPTGQTETTTIERLTSADPQWRSVKDLSLEPVKVVNWQGDFFFLDARHGWAVARNGEEIALVVTTDGGQTWDLLRPAIAP